MKKEIFAFILLLAILVVSIYNTCRLTRLTNELVEHIEQCQTMAVESDWKGAAKSLEAALELWNSKENYTHIVLRHNEIDTMTDDFYQLMYSVYKKDINGTYANSRLVITHLNSISKIERINFGSIF